ncbi:transposase [Myxococcus dinghuensis]|uniref:transposase n=1 Tax=Myxococcus dinghuensis TaxID=2906761 RepID=UPI003898F47F
MRRPATVSQKSQHTTHKSKLDHHHALQLVPDAIWNQMTPLFQSHPRKKSGRPQAADRDTPEAIVFALRSGISWEILPRQQFAPSAMTAWRRLRESARRFGGALTEIHPPTGDVGSSPQVLPDRTMTFAINQPDTDLIRRHQESLIRRLGRPQMFKPEGK